MSNGLDEVSGAGHLHGSLPVSGHFTASEKVPPTAFHLDLGSNPFAQIDADYKHSRIIYTTLRGRGSTSLEGLLSLSWNLQAFMKWVKAEAERVAFEVQVTRETNKRQDYWSAAKQAFKAELDRIRNK